MNAKLVEPAANGATQLPRRILGGKFPWSGIAIGAFAGSGISFISGLLASLASLLGILPVSPVTARWTVCLLLAAFILAFVGAHSVDRLGEAHGDSEPSD